MIKLFNVKCLMFSVILLYTLHFTHYTLFAQSISSRQLINNAKFYDGRTVIYAGEVIGDIMCRGEFSWMNVNDGVNALGIWIGTALTKEVEFTGSYKFKGDQIEVVGVFHRACPEHGGDLDIHGQSLRPLARGFKLPQELNLKKRNLAGGLLGILVLIWILMRLKIL